MLHDPKTLADLFGTDAETVLSFSETGVLPAPMTIGNRLVRWSIPAISKWVSDGCPASVPMSEIEFVRLHQTWSNEVLAKQEAKERRADMYAEFMTEKSIPNSSPGI